MQGSTRIDELRQKFHENPRRYFAPLANEYRKAGDPEQAIAICRAHLAQQPGHMSGHVVYGQALFDAKRSDEARVVFEKALSLDPDNAIVLKQLGDIAREKGDTSEARHWYTRALDADANDRETAAYLAELAEPVTEQPAVEEPVAELETVELSPPEPEAPEVKAEPESEQRESEQPESEQPIPVSTEAEVSWRKTPQHEESPFVTRTMAELYASQGYRQAALDVYKQLALQHPDDKEIFDRIESLERAETRNTPSAPVQTEQTPFEPVISDMPVDSAPESFTELADEVFAPSSEDLNLDIPAAATDKPDPHFTEQELSTGDSWDTDSWAAGFAADEDLNLDFDSPDVPAPQVPSEESASPQAEVEVTGEAVPETPAEAETGLDDAGAQLPDEVQTVEEVQAAEEVQPQSEPEQEPAAAESSLVDAEPEPLLSEPVAEDLAEEPLELAAVEQESDELESVVADELDQEARDDQHFVAYSPQLPEDADLPHYAPKGPTVREFFATLGAFRPSARPGSSITAQPGIPEPAADFPLASDAFASLFSDSQVSDDDSRAAFALSGALGTTGPTPAALTAPVEPQPAQEPAASTTTTQESEEDIRRFREWLDGLADS